MRITINGIQVEINKERLIDQIRSYMRSAETIGLRPTQFVAWSYCSEILSNLICREIVVSRLPRHMINTEADICAIFDPEIRDEIRAKANQICSEITRY